MNSKNSSQKDNQAKKKSGLRENIEAVIVAIVLALFIRTFVVQAFKIPSGSMIPTLLVGDHILVSKFIYGIKIPYWGKTIIPVKKPKRGDIVVFKFPKDPSKDFIKRVIGIAGDVVKIRNKKVFINDKPLKTSYGVNLDKSVIPAIMQPRDNFGPVTVPSDSLFVMGDNRDHSYDSRFWGFVNLSALRGKAFIIYWSWNKNKEGFGVRWNRLGDFLK